MKICKSCGEINPNDTEYCAKCGQSDFAYSEDLKCPICGAANSTNNAFCTECGYDFTPVKPVLVTSSELARFGSNAAPRQEGNVLEEALAEAEKETVECPNCHTQLQINSIFCYKCGASVASLNDHRNVKRKVCTVCGTPNLMESQFCSYCFSSLMDADIEDFQLVHETRQVGDKVYKQALLQNDEGKYKICNNCGTLNRADEMFCVKCGLKLDMEEQTRYCVKCGAENDSEAQYCTRCQWPFDGASLDNVGQVWSCSKCKHMNDANSAFCAHCGAPRHK